MKARCTKCGDNFILSAEEEDLMEAGYLQNPICDDCYEEETGIDPAEFAEYMSYSDADPGL